MSKWDTPQPPPKGNRRTGRRVGCFGCLGAIAVLAVIAVIALASSGGGGGGGDGGGDGPGEGGSGKVTFKVWGEAPSGVDITYGSDTENIQGGGLPMTETLKFDDAAEYYAVTAQLEGGGDIRCSVTVQGETKEAHAQGGYNICNAQLSSDGLGGWG